MARILTYVVIVVLGIFVITTTFLLDGDGSGANPDAPEGTISIHDLSLQPARYKGDTVTTVGNVMFSADTNQHQVVEDGQAIVITGHEVEALRALEGQHVSVTGRFDFDAETGIYIDAEEIRRIE